MLLFRLKKDCSVKSWFINLRLMKRLVPKPSVTKTTIEVILDPEPTKEALVADKDVLPVLNEVSCDSAVGSLLSSLYTSNGTLG